MKFIILFFIIFYLVPTVYSLSVKNLDDKYDLTSYTVENNQTKQAFILMKEAEFEENHSIFGSFIAALTMILLSETGDKTFLIMAVLAMKHDRFTIFLGGSLAQVTMALTSCFLGVVLPMLIPHLLTDVIAMLLFFYFGFSSIYLNYSLIFKPSNNTQNSISKDVPLDELPLIDENSPVQNIDAVLEDGHGGFTVKKVDLISWMKVFWLIFLAEWGDRSQISTIALSAARNTFGVALGTIFGQIICAGLAVLFGKLISSKVSESVVSYVGGVVFLAFGFHSLYIILF